MASKKLDKLKTAGADMDKFFSGAEQSEPEEKEEIKVVFKGSGKREIPVSTPDFKPAMSIKMDEKKPSITAPAFFMLSIFLLAIFTLSLHELIYK